MKKYLITVIIVTIISLLSCDVDEWLDIPQQGVLSVQDSYTKADDDMTKSFITAIYHQIRGSMYVTRFLKTNTSFIGLRAFLTELDGSTTTVLIQQILTSDNFNYSAIWTYHYTIIYWCNLIIENLPDNNVATQTVKDQVIAEARTIRAIMMMYLVQLWGTPPLADHILTGLEGNTPAEESWAFIEDELNAAAQGLPSKNGLDGQSAIGGRLTKEAAYAYLGKAYLWQGKYSEAASTLYNKVISTDLYQLIDDYTELNSYTSDFCSEYLWECDITNASGTETAQAGRFDIIYNWGNNAFFFPDEIYSGVGWTGWSYPTESFGSFMEAHDTLSDGTRTQRYRGTLATYEELLDESLFSYSSGKKGYRGAETADWCEGYFSIKYTPRKENIMGGPSYYNSYLHNNFPYMRYSEVLLNYAEAVAMGGAPGAMSGLEALNLVRQRAGLPDAPALDMDNEQYGVKAERWAELDKEGCRFIDLIRWGDAPTVLADVGKHKSYFRGYLDGINNVIQSKDQWNIQTSEILAEGFIAGKHELFPIPLTEINKNPNLTQNPGW